MFVSVQEHALNLALRDLPKECKNRYNDAADRALRQILFRSLAGDNDEHLRLFFPQGPPDSIHELWSLRAAQGAIDGAEYTAAARGHACGHIFKTGEASYRCKTCSTDETCVLCAKCFDASDHEGHMVFVNTSPGNSGCCDCGDAEAWIRPVNCNIHTNLPETTSQASGKCNGALDLPTDLVESIRMTIGRALDYLCDVFSCSPEQLRLPKTEQSIMQDERMSRLTSHWYEGPDVDESEVEFALVLWNDEKHTVDDVRDQVARACQQSRTFATRKAWEVNDRGRSVIKYSSSLVELLAIAKIIEEIKVTVTIRSSRDTFREQMCGTIIEWISDICGCSVGEDGQILRQVICEELLQSWRRGSDASNVDVGRNGIDDHEVEDFSEELYAMRRVSNVRRRNVVRADVDQQQLDVDDDGDGDDEDGEEEDIDESTEENDEEDMEIDHPNSIDATEADRDVDLDMDLIDDPDDVTEVSEAAFAGYPPPPPPPHLANRRRGHDHTLVESENGDLFVAQDRTTRPLMDIPRTPRIKTRPLRPPRPPRYWLEKPKGYGFKDGTPLHENLWDRVRLDILILYDLRMWKKLRSDLRDVYVSTVVTIPYFKRVLGLRFAGLYTMLAQLYLIADREPDHSIINLSLQMLTTPSITAEVLERGNFLTNLMAILYTFLTTRQVGYPSNVNPLATLAFDAGAVTNRRMYHFFLDLKYLFGSEYVQKKLCREDRYLLQFLDLIKLVQGICPNVRAVGEHIEYETDIWISASLITREINRLCRQYSDSFPWPEDLDFSNVSRAIRRTAKTAVINSVGAESKRFSQAEIKDEIRFHSVEISQFGPGATYNVVEFSVDRGPMSFHHPLHYLLSWLIDRAKSMSRTQLVSLLQFSAIDLREQATLPKASVPDLRSEQYILALFDYPLRVCAWLSQMRAGLWVRNGITLRHQMTTYRGPGHRDVSHQRDIFLLQVALIVCGGDSCAIGATFLAQIVDRFNVRDWMTGQYDQPEGYEANQLLDVVEDFTHLLIILLSERTSLVPISEDPRPQLTAIRRDIAHVLCFGPLSFSGISAKLADKVQESEDFQAALEEMATFRAPEGLSDCGTFELNPQYLELIDPYIAHYNKNQREDAETVLKAYISNRTGKPVEDVVYEPKLRPIHSGVFADLANFTRTPLFAQVIYYSLGFALQVSPDVSTIPVTRIETYIQVVLHLTLLATLEDGTDEDRASAESFVSFALSGYPSPPIATCSTIVSALYQISQMEHFKGCSAKVHLILRRIRQKRPKSYAVAFGSAEIMPDRMETASPANLAERATRKRHALERQAKVMAQFKQQQNSFLENQNFDWGGDVLSDSDGESILPAEEMKEVWKYPSGTCILCQEETHEQRLYGTFAYIRDSNILRQTVIEDEDYVAEVFTTPLSLDRSADTIRPFGVASQNRCKVSKVTSDGRQVITERQDLGKGFPSSHVRRAPVATGCGHIMHYSCFEVYVNATQRRHNSQIARNHPERLDTKEFICPLCKALGNAFLPIIWRGEEEVYPGAIETRVAFHEWLASPIHRQTSRHGFDRQLLGVDKSTQFARHHKTFVDYTERAIISPLATKLCMPARPAGELRRPSLTRGMLASIRQRDGEESLNPTYYDEAVVDVQPQGAVPELTSVYERLRDSLRLNGLYSRYTYPEAPSHSMEDLAYTDTLSRSFGYSISGIEIAQRGIGCDPGSTLLEKIPQQSLTHLRVLSATVKSYIAVGGLRDSALNRAAQEFADTQNRQLHQLLAGHPQLLNQSTALALQSVEPLLSLDPFVFLAECSACIVPAFDLDVHHILRLCYLAEVVKVVVVFLHKPKALFQSTPSTGDNIQRSPIIKTNNNSNNENSKPVWPHPEAEVFSAFVDKVKRFCQDAASVVGSDGDLQAENGPSDEDVFYQRLRTVVSSYALPFVRKAVILMHVHFGVKMPNTGTTAADAPELDRLTKVLRLPSLNEVFSSFLGRTETSHITQSIVSGWIQHWTSSRDAERSVHSAITLSHAAIFELVGLPRNFDTLTDEAIRRKCPTTGKELTDPCVCLFCGAIFCSQAVCCLKDKNKGGCTQHRQKCGGNTGIFINIRKCMVLFMDGANGTWTLAPYMDKHGEADPTLRRHQQLFLSQKRYDKLLRDVWLSHGIPSTISRKLEGDVNNGGWETL
ncbi:RING finger domain-containing protein [Cryomyces antarcticus]